MGLIFRIEKNKLFQILILLFLKYIIFTCLGSKVNFQGESYYRVRGPEALKSERAVLQHLEMRPCLPEIRCLLEAGQSIILLQVHPRIQGLDLGLGGVQPRETRQYSIVQRPAPLNWTGSQGIAALLIGYTLSYHLVK